MSDITTPSTISTPPAPTGGQNRQALVEWISRAKTSDYLAQTADAEILDQFRATLESGRIGVFIVGQFRNGKSTLVNALLGGREVCPVSIHPTTGRVIRIVAAEPGEPEGAEIIFRDGGRQSVPLDRVAEYVVDGGAHYAKTFEARVKWRMPETFRWIEWVDTPGMGSLEAAHDAETQRVLEAAQIVVVVLHAIESLTRAEADWLLQTLPYRQKMLFVLNRIDQVVPAERDAKCRDVVRQLQIELGLPTPPPMFPLSARRAVEAQISGDAEKLGQSGFVEFAQKLEQLAGDDTGAMQRMRDRLRAIVAHAVGRAEMERDALRGQVDLHATVAELKASLDATRDERKRIVAALRERLTEQIAWADSRWRAMPSEICVEFKTQVAQWDQATAKSETSGWVRRALAHWENEFQGALQRRIDAEVAHALAEFRRLVATLNSRLDVAAELNLGVGQTPMGSFFGPAALTTGAVGAGLLIGKKVGIVSAAAVGPIGWVLVGVGIVGALWWWLFRSADWGRELTDQIERKLTETAEQKRTAVSAVLTEAVDALIDDLNAEFRTKSGDLVRQLESLSARVDANLADPAARMLVVATECSRLHDLLETIDAIQ